LKDLNVNISARAIFVTFVVLIAPSLSKAQPLTRSDFDLPVYRLDMPFDSVLVRLGSPLRIHHHVIDPNYEGFSYPKLIAWRNKLSNTLIGLDIKDPTIKTRRGLKLGDSVDVAERLYGKPLWVGGDFDFMGPYVYPIHRPSISRLYLDGDYHLVVVSHDTLVNRILLFRELWLNTDDYNIDFLKLGSPFDSVAVHLLQPDSVRPYQEDSGYSGYYFQKLIVWQDNSTGKVVAFDVYDSSYATRRGLRVGDSVSTIEKLYGNRRWREGTFSRVGPYDSGFRDYSEATIFGASYYFILFTKDGRLVKILSYLGVDE
jgi:hypothetical protein